MGKYDPLGGFLRAQRAQEIPMSFSEIERVLGTSLPPKAQHQRAWWSNNPANNVMTKVWLEAGFETERVDMGGRKLVFRRVRREAPAGPSADTATDRNRGGGRHPGWGALKDTVKVAEGVDLAQPFLEPWGGETW